MQTATQRVPETARYYAEEVRSRTGRHVREIILFGSQARGQGTPSSDFDFIVVLDKKEPSLREAVIDAGAAILNRTDCLCAALVYGESDWKRVLDTPFGWNVRREGVSL